MQPTRRILIVEDESLVAYSLDRQLTRLGYIVVGRAATGAEAVRYAETRCPHVVLMDIHLRGTMDGVETAHRIRAQRSIPIVFLSAYADTATIERLRATGAAAYLGKPIAEQVLRETLERVLSPSQTAPPHQYPLPHCGRGQDEGDRGA